MADMTITNIYLPIYLYKNLPFWIMDKLKNDFTGNININSDGIEINSYEDIKKDWIHIEIGSTKGDAALNYIKTIMPAFAGSVDHDGYSLAYAQRNGLQVYENSFSGGDDFGLDEENGNKEYDDDDSGSSLENAMDAKQYSIEALEELFDNKYIDNIPLQLNDDEFNLILNNIKVNSVSSAIDVINNKKHDDIYVIACMRYVANIGVEKDINKLTNFYVIETPVGNPIPFDAKDGTYCVEYRIVSRGVDVQYNEIPLNIYLLKGKKNNNFNPKGKEVHAKCISDVRGRVFSSNKWFCVSRGKHKNAPEWLNIQDKHLDVLVLGVITEIAGEIGNYINCNKIVCNGKELTYIIVGKDSTGLEYLSDMLTIYTGEIEDVPVKDFKVANILRCERTEKYRGLIKNQHNSYNDSLRKDICRIKNVYDVRDVLEGLMSIRDIYHSDLGKIVSININDNDKEGTLIKRDGERITFKIL